MPFLSTSSQQQTVDVRRFGAVGDGVTDDTAAMQAAASSGYDIIVPAGNFRHGPIVVSSSIRFLGGSQVTPIFSSNTNEKLYEVTSPNVTIDGLNVSSVSGSITANKYIIHISGAANCRVLNLVLTDITTGDNDLKVTHGVYIQSSSDNAIVSGCTINNISGSAVFMKDVSSAVVRDNHITDTGWYSITLDQGCYDCWICNNTIDGDGELSRYYGGSINLMSQHPGNVNRRIFVLNNKISGVHNYGACIRVLSTHDSVVSGNIISDCVAGSLAASERLQYIGVDRRCYPGQWDQGPCTNIVISNNNLVAGEGSYIGIYIKNMDATNRDPSLNISVIGNIISSSDPTHVFESGVLLHGGSAGFVGVTICDNIMSLLTTSGSILGGGISIASSDAGGEILSLLVKGNIVRDIISTTPSSSYQTGIYINGYARYPIVRGNIVKNFFYGVRSGTSNITDPIGLSDNTQIDCVNPTLLSTPPIGGGFNMSLGTTIPTKGIYTAGHVRQRTNAAASESWGWIVTTAGGAMTAAWASGQTYTAGAWYRNATGKVYELIAAGGGTTSVQPTGSTTGADETGADGYVWRCRATTSARWATLPALGAAVALP